MALAQAFPFPVNARPWSGGVLVHKVNRWRADRDNALGNIWDAITLPFDLWRRV